MPNADRTQRYGPDGCLTDPEPDMKMRQAHFRYMRSKCRCSCVLQFTRHHRVSSVLHRPPSQMIHCIVLCFLILGPEVQRVCEMYHRREGLGYRNPTWGDQNLFRGGSSLNCLCEHPTTRHSSPKREGQRKGYSTSNRAVPTWRPT